MQSLMTNWKTSLAGVVLIVVGILGAVLGVDIPGFSMAPGAAITAGIGLLLAKDGAGPTVAKVLLAAFLLSLFLAPRAEAGDIASPAVKAPAGLFSNSYPYGTSGWLFGLYTEGGASAVTGSAAGASSSSLTSVSAGAGLTLGYSWGQKNSQMAYSIEGDAGWTNFNGSTPGFAFSGPAEFEIRGVVMTPLSNVMSYLPSWSQLFGTIAPFNPLPAGVSAGNLQVGLMAGAHFNDISTYFPGVASNREWEAQPMVGILAMEQLSNGTAVRSFVKELFGNRAVCAGVVPNTQACMNKGTTTLVGAGVYF
jgi:hypothetical protein